MKLNLFWRLIIGYLVIFTLVLAVGVYAMVQIKRLNRTTRYILDVDQNILEYNKKIADRVLSQHRFLKKFLITKDQSLYKQYQASGEGVIQDLDRALAISDVPAIRQTYQRIRVDLEKYQSVAAEEIERTQGKPPYPAKRVSHEKGTLLDRILEDLNGLEIRLQQDIHQRMKLQGEASDSAGTVAAGLSLLALISILVISLLFTRSITRPLNLLRLKTREISEGVFTNDLAITAPPEIVELAQSFNRMSHKLLTLDKMKSDFFSTMSHELRTPLTSIKEGVALLEEGAAGPITEKQKKLLSIIAQESRRLIDLINSSLDLSKMESGMMTYRFEDGDLSSLLEKVIREMTPLIDARGILLERDFRETLPRLRMDRERVLQVLRNLLSNAVKFSPDKGVITLSARTANQGVEVAIKDNGPGIPGEHLLTIFNKFHQVLPANPYRIKGTGLGLAIVKHIIQSHGGTIWVESTIGTGSTFFFWLPA